MCVTGMHGSNVLGTVTVLEPTPFPHLSYVLGDIKFVGKTSSRFKCRIEHSLAAAALTPRLLKHCKEVDIDHFHVSLAHAYASVLKVTAKQHGIRLFSGERESATHSTSRDEAGNASAGTCPHRHCWTLPNFSRGVALRCDVRRQRLASTAAVRRARKERERYRFCCETLCGRSGSPTRVPH